MRRHRQLNVNCAFVQGTSDNIRIQSPQQQSPIVSISGSLLSPLFQSNVQIAQANVQTMTNKVWNNFDDLNTEIIRLQTFNGWPLSFINPAELAKSG